MLNAIAFSILVGSSSLLSHVDHDYSSPEEAAREISALSQELERSGDPRALFPGIYALTISSTTERLARDEFHHPLWVKKLVVNYANLYRRTIYDELTGNRSRLPRAWQLEFSYVQMSGSHWSPDLDLVYGINVHIARDLVEALFETPENFASETVRADFFWITEILRQSLPKLWSVYTRYGNRLNVPAGLEQAVMMNWISKLRARAWTNALAAGSLSLEQKKNYLQRIDDWIANLALHNGLLLPVLPQ